VHHSDHGSQYVSIRYSERLAEAGIEPSVGSTGDSYDNALAETINGPPRNPERFSNSTSLCWRQSCCSTRGVNSRLLPRYRLNRSAMVGCLSDSSLAARRHCKVPGELGLDVESRLRYALS